MQSNTIITARRLGWIFGSPIGPRIHLSPADDAGAQDAAGAGGDPAGGDASGGGDPDAQGQAQGGDGGSPSIYRPEGLPDHLLGTNDQETIDKLAKAYGGARRDIGRGDLGEVPEKPDGYQFAFSDPVKEILGDVEKDDLLLAVREDAHKMGLTDKQFSGFLDAAFGRMLDMGLVEPPVDLAKELDALAPDGGDALDEAGRKSAIEARIRDNAAIVDVWKSRGMPAESGDALQALLDTAGGNKAIEWFRGKMGSPQPVPGGKPSGAATEADLTARSKDPRNQFGTREYDPAFAAETTRLYQQHYGDEPRA